MSRPENGLLLCEKRLHKKAKLSRRICNPREKRCDPACRLPPGHRKRDCEVPLPCLTSPPEKMPGSQTRGSIRRIGASSGFDDTLIISHIEEENSTSRDSCMAPFSPKESLMALSSSEGFTTNPSSPNIHIAMQWKPLHGTDHHRKLELRLMHHYLNVGHHVLPHRYDPRGRKLWQVDVPRMAFSSETALNALLAVSALHLKSMFPGNSVFAGASQFYFGRTLQRYQKSILSPEYSLVSLADPIIATSLLVTFFTWVSSHTSTSSGKVPVELYRVASGIWTMFDHLALWIKGTDWEWYVAEPYTSKDVDNDQSIFSESFRESIARILSTLDEKVPLQDRRVYEKIARYLNSLRCAIVDGCHHTAIHFEAATMAFWTPRRLWALTARNDPRTSALMAHLSAFTSGLEPVWWFHGLNGPRSFYGRIKSLYEIMPEEWKWAMQRPLQIVAGLTKPEIKTMKAGHLDVGRPCHSLMGV